MLPYSGLRSADVDGLDARSKLAILAALAFGEKLDAGRHLHGRHPAHYAGRFRICASTETHNPAAVPGAAKRRGLAALRAPESDSAIGDSRAGTRAHTTPSGFAAVYGEDTFYYGRGAGSKPTGVAVVSDLMRVAREIRFGSPERVSPFAHERLGEYKPLPITDSGAAVLSALSSGRQGGHHRHARDDSRQAQDRHRCGTAAATRRLARPALCHHDRTGHENRRFATRWSRSGRRIFWWSRRSPCRWSGVSRRVARKQALRMLRLQKTASRARRERWLSGRKQRFAKPS